ncbi:MAG TPA: glycosyltransferase family 2 protein, partial [Anaerolineae bacterium]|nr:glycosyltransferase family 2 protein [Anaerolineae bacterium]
MGGGQSVWCTGRPNPRATLPSDAKRPYGDYRAPRNDNLFTPSEERALTSLSVVLPAYNEEANIGPMIEDVVRVVGPLVDDYEIVVVDDGSRDQTATRVREKAAEHPQVRLVQHEVNKGYGAAVFTGLTS